MKNLTLIIAILILKLIFSVPVLAQERIIDNHPPLNRQQIDAVTDTLCKKLREIYVFPDKGKQISDYLQSQLKKGIYYTANDPLTLALQLTSDIQKIHADPHMTITTDMPRPGPPIRRGAPGGTGRLLRREENISSADENYQFKKLEVLPGNIGYLRLDMFTNDLEGVKPTLEAALRFLAHTQALILDLRYNGGGSGAMVAMLESYFFNHKTLLTDVISRLGNDTTHFYADPAQTGGLYLSMPVYILTSPGTFSAAEDFSYGMQSIKRAITVGNVTRGGAHLVGGFPIGYGLLARIPFSRSFNPYTHTDWEGTGVKPDIRVRTDSALRAALVNIYQTRISQARDIAEKNQARWLLEKLQISDTPLPESLLKKYCGQYGRFYIFNDHGELKCTDGQIGNFSFSLSPAGTETFFAAAPGDLKMEFLRAGGGSYTQLKVEWPDGRVLLLSK
jgi:hypothetical protein